jgi:hypothetical protein
MSSSVNVNASSDRHGAAVTLPQEEVLRLTMMRGDSEVIFDDATTNMNDHDNDNDNGYDVDNAADDNTDPCAHSLEFQTESGSSHLTMQTQIQTPSSTHSDHPSVMLQREQVLSLTMQTTNDTFSFDSPSQQHNNNNNKSSGKKKTKVPRTKSGSSKDGKQREKPKRTRSSGSSKLKKAVKNEKKSVDAVVAAAIRNYGGSTDGNTETEKGDKQQQRQQQQLVRNTPQRTKSNSNGRVAAAIRNFEETEPERDNNGEVISSSRRKSRSRSAPKRTKSGSGGAKNKTNNNDASSTKKKSRRSAKRRTATDETPRVPLRTAGSRESPALVSTTATDHVDHEQEEDPHHYLPPPLDNVDPALSPPPLDEAVSSASFASVDRAGAIAVFPSDSIHATQRRSMSRQISDNDTTIADLNRDANNCNYNSNNDEEAQIGGGGGGRSPINLDSTVMTYEEIPEPPQSQIIDATATYQQESPQLSPPPENNNRPMPPAAPTPTQMRAARSGVVHSSAMSTSGMTSVTMPSTTVNSSTDDNFLGAGLVQDAESGTVTARAISSEDYYAEVRRQLRAEAVVAVDVVPLSDDGRPIDGSADSVSASSSGSKNRNGNRYTKNKARVHKAGKPRNNDQEQKPATSRRTTRRKWWVVVGVIVVIILIAIVVAAMRRKNRMCNSKMDCLMNSEAGKIWRSRIAQVLPKKTLEGIIDDPDYESPQYKAFVYVVENAEELFDINPFDTEQQLSHIEKSRVSTVFALVTLYHSTNGDNWYVKNDWLQSDVDVCEWQGVHCKGDEMPKASPNAGAGRPDRNNGNGNGNGNGNNNNRVGNDDDAFDKTVYNNWADDDSLNENDFNDDSEGHFAGKLVIHGLELPVNGLSGSIPDEICLLTNIAGGINLSGNTIFGTIPPGIGELSKLRGLDLHSNQLESSLPTELGQLTNLRKFDISGNKEIKGDFPLDLRRWTKIGM